MDSVAALEENAEEVTETLKILSNPVRLLLLCHIHEQEQSVGDLARKMGRRSSLISQQLALLRAHGLVTTRRDGTTIYYQMASSEIAGLISYLHENFCRQD